MVTIQIESRTLALLVLVLTLSAAGLSCSGGEMGLAPTTPSPALVPGRAATQSGAPDDTFGPLDSHTVLLTGTVTNSSGEAIPGAIITILDGENAGRSTGTDTSGRYQFEGLLPSNGNLSATATFYEEKRDGVYINGTNTLNFTLTRATVSLRGLVQNSSGTVISGATVTILDGPNKDSTSTTNSNGDYRFDSITAADVNVSAAAAGYQTGFRGVSANGTNTLNFTLTATAVAPAVSITATLVNGGGNSSEIELVATVVGNPTVTHYNWKFGDGASAGETGAVERHIYRRGTYTASVEVVRPSGGSLEGSLEFTVE